MFSLFRKATKTTKRESYKFPAGFIDIHSHLLPNIDDGSTSFQSTIEMLLELKALGITQFVFTPHVMEGVWENSKADILARKDELLNRLQTIPELNDLKIRVAAEYMMDDNFRNNLIRAKDLLTIKDNKVLVEMSYMAPPIHLYETLAELQVAGYKPILAHPERYRSFHQDLKEYDKLKLAGCEFQINLLSLTNYYGVNVHETALYLLKNGYIDYCGSDTHNDQHIKTFETFGFRTEVMKLMEPIFENNKNLI
ncbi:tyrosine-protein phosphatase [Vaginella massiliensis]|uniref:tyrosine-protein phosphatase n=1 Tax=Vaginella massiliensis TaxID=1816680 RepID=UPI000B9A1B4D|nr:CpsB/CapC family capsule biosynthesis tyrosine phosphatase [Vaginella massiliensis]